MRNARSRRSGPAQAGGNYEDQVRGYRSPGASGRRPGGVREQCVGQRRASSPSANSEATTSAPGSGAAPPAINIPTGTAASGKTVELINGDDVGLVTVAAVYAGERERISRLFKEA